MLRQLVILAVVVFAFSAVFSSKIHGELKRKSSADIVVSFNESTEAILKNMKSMKFTSRGAKVFSLERQLEGLRESSQKNVIKFLESRKINFKSFWINNHLYVKEASAQLIKEIASFAEVAQIREQSLLRLASSKIEDSNDISKDGWNIERIEADKAWALPGGTHKRNSVVAMIDTGAMVTHELLKGQPSNQNGWYDAIDGGSDIQDTNGHGTFTAGIVVSVAPDAQLIFCRGFNNFGETREEYLVDCGQWLTLQAPDIISSSWADTCYSCDDSVESLYPVIEAWHAVDITPVVAIGNTQLSMEKHCYSNLAPGNWNNTIGVGSTTPEDSISAFSAKGPTQDRRIKPDITAPGSFIRSAGIRSDTFYTKRSGTSFAAAHVSAVVALLKSRNPNLTFPQIKHLLQDNADQNLTAVSLVCGGIQSSQFPNHIYGHGRINARASLQAAINAQ